MWKCTHNLIKVDILKIIPYLNVEILLRDLKRLKILSKKEKVFVLGKVGTKID